DENNKVSKRKFDHLQGEQSEEHEDNQTEFAQPSVWVDWLNLLANHEATFHPYSPEANNIIRSGKGISPKPYLDRELYTKHMENCDETSDSIIPEAFIEFIDATVGCDDLVQFKHEIRKLTIHMVSLNKQEIENLEVLEGILWEAYKMYSSYINKEKYEDSYNQLLIWPYLEIIAMNVQTSNCKSGFESGQPHLNSMNSQLKANGIHFDEKSFYKSDGLIRAYGIKQLELLVLETSGHFGNTDKVKINFDHHKGKQLHLWSMSFRKEGVFNLWREEVLTIKPEYEERDEYVPDLVKFCWTMKCLLEELVENIIELKKDHKSKLASYRYNAKSPASLQDIVRPIILKLTKDEDSSDMNS
ncbi:hypothetical protein CU098_005447, partial [Rhizopus stolonifer]